MSDHDKGTSKKDDDDKELAELLDNLAKEHLLALNMKRGALQDFSASASSAKSSDNKIQSQLKENETNVAEVPQEWTTEFVQQAAQQFEENFARLLTGNDAGTEISPDVVQEKLKQMADAAQEVLSNPTEISDQSVDFAASISQAIAGLNQGQENLATPFNEDDLTRMFGNAGSGQEGDILPFMQGMMQGLLSKDVLGPSLQDFVEKLPPYLEKNKDKLPKEEVERYENQKKLMEEVLEELNKEKPDDNLEVKKDRFSKVLSLMQKLQDFGQPPSELVGDVDTPFTFDPTGNPMAMPPSTDPSANPDCCVM